MKTIVCNTKFKLDSFSDGGSKRAMQIRELLAENGLTYKDDPFVLPKKVSKGMLFKWAIRAMVFIQKHYPKKSIHSVSQYFRLIKYYALRIPIIYDKYYHSDVVFLWENTNDRDILYLMNVVGKSVVGMPHNIESLVQGRSIAALKAEVMNLDHCDTTFTISKEEAWLLRLLGLSSYYLPYYPPQAAEAFLLSIREQRTHRNCNSRQKFVLLGSATNNPTRTGMQAMIDYMATQSLSFDFFVAGYGTESLAKVSHPGISMLGTLSNDALQQLLLEADAVLIFQPPTTGALTRIPEMLIAGIPVFANFDAARNYYENKDVIVYQSFEDLFRRLVSFKAYDTELFKRDVEAEQTFIRLISQACQ